MSQRITVRVVYRGGATIDIECDDVDLATDDGILTGITWHAPSPEPLLTGVGEIAAVWWLSDRAVPE